MSGRGDDAWWREENQSTSVIRDELAGARRRIARLERENRALKDAVRGAATALRDILDPSER